MRQRLRDHREGRKLSVSEMAKVLGVSESFYYKIEEGARNPTIKLAKRIADILGETVDHLFFS